jgi:NitT/TauT family transport system substrate-binding protein
VLLSCTPASQKQKIRIAINPWPGYEFLYLAAQKGFFAENGLDVEIVELSSLADVQRVYVQGRVDGFGSTVIEAVQAAGLTQSPLDIVLIPDFSNGGDEIIANAVINSMSDLKGKRVGAEVGSLGMYVLHAALVKHGMTLDDVSVVNVEQLNAETTMKSHEIDAVVTYPPYSIAVSKLPGHKQIFNTSEIPNKVIDTISIRQGLIADQREWIQKFHQVWEQALIFAQTNQQEAYEIMAKREGVTVAEFADALTGLTVVNRDKQHDLLKSEQLKRNIRDVCNVLKRSESIKFSCDNINQLVQGYQID